VFDYKVITAGWKVLDLMHYQINIRHSPLKLEKCIDFLTKIVHLWELDLFICVWYSKIRFGFPKRVGEKIHTCYNSLDQDHVMLILISISEYYIVYVQKVYNKLNLVIIYRYSNTSKETFSLAAGSFSPSVYKINLMVPKVKRFYFNLGYNLIKRNI
jgi:hypothetical protein